MSYDNDIEKEQRLSNSESSHNGRSNQASHSSTDQTTTNHYGDTTEEQASDESLMKIDSGPALYTTMSLPREIAFVAVICLAQFCTQVGLGQCLALVHVIGNHFGLSNPGELSWLIAAYSLTVGTFILVAGRFGDLFGYKRMWIIGFSWFSVWSMVAGLSTYSNHVLFDFARVFQGIGPAIILPK